MIAKMSAPLIDNNSITTTLTFHTGQKLGYQVST